MPPKPRTPDEPTPAERLKIERHIELLPLMRRDAPGLLDWPAIAARLAEQLDATTKRMPAGSMTDADAEQIQRAHLVLRDYQRAVAAEAAD